MTINLDNAHSNLRNRIKLQPLTAITGAALALSGASALGGWQGGSGAEVTDNTQLAIDRYSTLYHQAEIPQVAYYLVASQPEADQANFLDEAEPSRKVNVLLASSEAQEADAFEVIRKAFRDATGESITWVDLRGQSPSLAQEAGADGTR
jgi:hypothetical protein